MKEFKKYLNEGSEGKKQFISDLAKNKNNLEKNLSKEISKAIGIKVSLSATVSGDKITISSPDIAKKMGIKIFKTLSVENFGGNAFEEKGSWIYSFPINYHYSHFGGGKNGSDIGRFFADSNGKIIKSIIELK